MSLIKIKKCTAYRSIPTAFPEKHFFNSEINSIGEQEKLSNWVNASINTSDKWHDYGERENFGEFLFDKVNLPASRFTDGSFPVWYGTEDIETSLIEIEFNLKLDTQSEIESGFIDYQRAVCFASLDLRKNADVKHLAKSIPNYSNKSSYKTCFNEFKKLKEKGVTSLNYLSARNIGKECYAVTDKEEILSSVVTKFYRLRVFSEPSKATEVAELIFEQ